MKLFTEGKKKATKFESMNATKNGVMRCPFQGIISGSPTIPTWIAVLIFRRNAVTSKFPPALVSPAFTKRFKGDFCGEDNGVGAGVEAAAEAWALILRVRWGLDGMFQGASLTLHRRNQASY